MGHIHIKDNTLSYTKIGHQLCKVLLKFDKPLELAKISVIVLPFI